MSSTKQKQGFTEGDIRGNIKPYNPDAVKPLPPPPMEPPPPRYIKDGVKPEVRRIEPTLNTTTYKDSKAILPYGLTVSEVIILQWVSHGKKYSEIAQILESNESAVKQHMVRVLNKLGACTNSGAVAIALRKKIIT